MLLTLAGCLRRILELGESQLLMTEMQCPTAAFEEIVNQTFRPVFGRLVGAIDRLTGKNVPRHVNEQLAISVVGQCLYYLVGRGVVEILIPEEERRSHYDIDSLSKHIISVTLCATEQAALMKHKMKLETVFSKTMSDRLSSEMCGHRENGDTVDSRSTIDGANQ